MMIYVYDQYGNMTCQQNQQTQDLCPQYGFNAGAKQINNSGFSYDASGDLLRDNAHTYQYDAEHRLISVDSGTAEHVPRPAAFAVRVFSGGLQIAATAFAIAAGFTPPGLL